MLSGVWMLWGRGPFDFRERHPKEHLSPSARMRGGLF